MRTHRRADLGFSLVELCISLVLIMTLVAAIVSVATANSAISGATPENADLQQRARAGADAIAGALYTAGAGVYLGPATGPLRASFAPIIPRRLGLQHADPYAVAKPDAVTILSIPSTLSQSTLRDPLPSGSTDLRVTAMPNCSQSNGLCGLTAGTQIVVFDQEGHFDFFTVIQTQGDVARVRAWQSGHPTHSYAAGSPVSVAESHTYYLDIQNRQLRHFDGYLTDTPVVDDVVGLSFEYFGDPVGPVSPRPAPGAANCLYDAAGALMGGLVLPSQGASLAPLPLSMLSDGPWCGEGENKFDADLLRIQKVRVTLRLQAGNDMFRGRSSAFAQAGRSLSAVRSVADFLVRFDVSPRNLIGSH